MNFLYGQEEFLINQKLNDLLSTYQVDPIYFSEKDDIEIVMMEIETISMFEKEKNIVIRNHAMFKDNEMADTIIKTISEIDLEGLNIFFVCTDNLDKKNNLIKYLLKNAQCERFSEIKKKDIPKIIQKLVSDRNGTINFTNSLYLANKLPINLRVIVNEVEKLLLTNNVITKEIIDIAIAAYHEDDYFAFSNAIINADSKDIIFSYQNKIRNNETFVAIINQISQTLDIALKVHSYKELGHSLQEIADINRLHIFRIKKANDLLLKSNIDIIKDNINKLAKLDFDIKTGKIESQLGLDEFILRLVK